MLRHVIKIRNAAKTFHDAVFDRFYRDQRGSYVIFAGLLMPALIGAAGLGTEAGMWYLKQQTMQGAADSAALSAATAYYTQGFAANANEQAKAVTASYGFFDGTNGTTVTVNQPPLSGPYASTPGAIEVDIVQPQKRLFSALWNTDQVTVSVKAIAVTSDTQGCVLSLDPTASGATTMQGTPNIDLQGCSLFDNSNAADALTMGGSASLSALSVGVVGGISGQDAITTQEGVAMGQSPIGDPYQMVSFPDFSGCDQHNYTGKNTDTLNPGVYCGGIKLNAGANVTLNPGVYYLDRGSLDVNGGATLTGDGVTLVFTSSTGQNYATAKINGSANVNLTAPTSGPTAGIAVFGDRNMPTGTSFSFEGGAGQSIEGAIYLPQGDLKFAGGSNAGNGCTQLIGDTITFTGNSALAVNCTGRKTRAIGSVNARLVQ